MSQINENKKKLEKKISDQKEQIYNLENEYKTKFNPNYKNESFSEKLSNDLAFFNRIITLKCSFHYHKYSAYLELFYQIFYLNYF